MKIVVLGGYVVTKTDLNWNEFKEFGELVVYDRTNTENEEVILDRISDADAILLNQTKITNNIINRATNLKYIGLLTTGYNTVDIVSAKNKGICVTNIPKYATESVAQFTFSLILEVVNQVGKHNKSVHEKEWTKSIDFTYTKSNLIDLDGKTLGLIGFGNIAQQVAGIAKAFGMRIIFYNHNKKEYDPSLAQQVDIETIYKKADIISLHIPQTEETEKIIDRRAISLMRPETILINTARGGLVDEVEVASALNNKDIYYYAADVASIEPIEEDNPLLHSQNTILTPHIAWQSYEARKKLINIALNNLENFIKGDIINQIN